MHRLAERVGNPLGSTSLYRGHEIQRKTSLQLGDLNLLKTLALYPKAVVPVLFPRISDVASITNLKPPQ